MIYKVSAHIACVITGVMLLACMALPALAWEDKSHRMGADTILPYLPVSMRDVIKRNQEAFYKGIGEEPELYDAVVKKHGRYERGLYVQEGITRQLYHIERIRFFLERNEQKDVLSYTLGQFVRSAMDLLEPQPGDGLYGPLEVSATRMYFLADFNAKNPKFDLLASGRARITNFPAHLDDLLKKNTADGDKIFKLYHKERNYPAVRSEAAASFNRTLNFLINALTTLETMTRRDADKLLDIRNWLGIDALRGYNNRGDAKTIKKPDAPSKPGAPSAPGKPKVNK